MGQNGKIAVSVDTIALESDELEGFRNGQVEGVEAFESVEDHEFKDDQYGNGEDWGR